MTRRMCLLAVTALVLALSPATGWACDDGDEATQRAWKLAHLDRVVAELTARTPAGLSEEAAKARAVNIERLRQYREAERYTYTRSFPGLALPSFIDDRGRRCALAHLIEVSGADKLLGDLARDQNHAFVPQVQRRQDLGTWLAAQGLTLEDAALIQGPGFVNPIPGDVVPGTVTGVPVEITVPGRDASGNPTTPRPSAAPTTGRRRASSAPTWESWWSLNRHAFLNLRASYHDVVVTGTDESEARPHRPRGAELESILLPFLREQAATAPRHTRATAVMAYARAGARQEGEQVVSQILAYLGTRDAPYRDLVTFGLGLARHDTAFQPLVDILQDTKAGRQVYRKTEGLDEGVRAHAAIALGQLGDVRAITPLLETLAGKRKQHVDLKACCVVALGSLSGAMSTEDRARTARTLMVALDKQRWADPVLAAIPGTVARLGDTAAMGRIVDLLARFRKPRGARQSAALALPLADVQLCEEVVDVLIATIRRDPDPIARRYALVSLGQLSLDTKPGAEEAVAKKLMRFYEGAFKRVHVMGQDLPWVYLSAALFGRAHRDHGETTAKMLTKVMDEGVREQRTAAVMALAVQGRSGTAPAMRAALAKSGDDRYRAYLSEALGILGDRDSRRELLALLRDDKSERVRYQAAVGLGFLADRTLVPLLIEALQESNAFAVKGALARIIGEVGDRAAIGPLMRMVTDEDETWTQRRALAALGMIGEDADQPWTADIKRAVNPAWLTPTLHRVMSIF